MIDDKDLRQRLNLIRESPTFVLRETGRQGEADVLTVTKVPKGGIYWIGGKCILKLGREVESVFRVDTDSGGSLLSVFWWIDSAWYRHEDVDALKKLGLAKEDAFPFDWRFSIALEKDIFHRT